MKKLFISAIALLGASLFQLNAAVSVTTSTSILTDHVFLNIGAEGTGNQRWQYYADDVVSGHVDAGQTFRAPTSGDIQLSQFAFKVSGVNGGVGADVPGAAFGVTIYRFASASAFTPESTVLTDGGVLPSSIMGNDYLVFSLSSPLTLDAGGYYGIVLSFTGQADDQKLSFVNVTNDSSYTDGRGVFYRNNPDAATMTWARSGGDFHLVLATIPEPRGMAWLAAAGLPLFLFWRNLRRRARRPAGR